MRIFPTSKPQILITMGDPSGIGPEVIAKAVASPEIKRLAIFVVIGDGGVMQRASETVSCNEKFAVHLLGEKEEISLEEGCVNIIDPGPLLRDIIPGSPTDEGAKKALRCLETAVGFMCDAENSSPRAMVTAPVSKERIARIHPGFIGHTEYLRDAYSSKPVTMVMTGNSLCVAPVTRHIPLKDVAEQLTPEIIVETLRQLSEGSEIVCGKKSARIGVCALNPHCGEGGKIGREEIEIITPAVEKAKTFYENIEGPVSADVIFYKAMKGEVDIVVSMYHDQGLSPFKMVDFDSGVNVTLGLPHVRTSPDHGTAFDIAGGGLASAESMEQAIKLAVRALKSN